MRSHAHIIRPRSTRAAIVLSAAWPGLGQWYLGDARTAALLAIPPLVLLLPLITSAFRGAEGLVAHLVVPANALWLTVFLALSLVFRLVSLALVRLRVGAEAARPHRSTIWLLTGVITVLHLTSGYAAIGLFGVTSRVFQSDLGTGAGPVPHQPQASSDLGVIPTAAAAASAPVERINVLLVGSDSGLGYRHALTDTIMVVSVDKSTNSVAMISVPRDIARFPMYSGGTYEGKINSLATVAAADPDQYPDGGVGTLARAVGHLIGAPIHYVAYVNLSGFRDLVDAVGGVDVVVQREINDRGYQFPDGQVGFHLDAGPQHLNGRLALAFVRSRNGAGENDFTRARRQQQLLVALRDTLTSPAMIPRLSGVLDAAAGLVATNFPPERIGEFMDLANAIQQENINGVVLGPPYAKRPNSSGEYILVPDLKVIAKWSTRLFGPSSRYYGT